MTQPFVLNDGRKSPYGLGWSTQVIGGEPVHWQYGYGDSYSALLIRLPRKKVSFILLCNCGAASAPFYLGYGSLLTSPFAVAFLREEMPDVIRDADEFYAQAFLHRYTAALSGGGTDTSRGLIARANPKRFTRGDRSTIYLLAALSLPSLDKEMETAVKAYDESGDFHPDIELAIAGWYKRAGVREKYLSRLHRIADRPGYGEEQTTREACVQLGTALLENGQELGRKYLWMAVQYGQGVGSKTEALENLIAKMRH